MSLSQQEVTQLLIRWGGGDPAAFDQLMPIVYAELRKMAKRHMSLQSPGHTLQTTALINEAYIRIAGDLGRKWQNRAHFFGFAATAMRHVLVDHARAAHTAKRGGERKPVPLEEAAVFSTDRMGEIVALDDALTALAKLHERQSKVVEMRFFGGLSVEETAEVLAVSPDTVMRDWRAAKAWLYRELRQPLESDSSAQ
jgi:RNA polymerase sigma-70 factor (ECF subfamily)